MKLFRFPYNGAEEGNSMLTQSLTYQLASLAEDAVSYTHLDVYKRQDRCAHTFCSAIRIAANVIFWM